MKKSLTLTLLICGMMWSSWASAGSAGTYALDKKPLLAKMQARIAKMPPKRRGFAGMMIAMIKGMKMNIALAKDGRASMSMKMVMFGRPRIQNSLGSWKTSGNTVLINVKPQANARRRRRRPRRNQALRCSILNGGKRLACVNTSRRKKETMFFDKVSENAVIVAVAKPKVRVAAKPKVRVAVAKPKKLSLKETAAVAAKKARVAAAVAAAAKKAAAAAAAVAKRANAAAAAASRRAVATEAAAKAAQVAANAAAEALIAAKLKEVPAKVAPVKAAPAVTKPAQR